MTTPNDIDVLLHYHVSPTMHERASAPAVQETTERYLREGILVWIDDETTRNGGYYKTTERGDAWVEMLLRVPYPRQAWVDETGTEVVRHNAELWGDAPTGAASHTNDVLGAVRPGKD